MQKRRDVGHLFVGHRHRRHAFIRTPKTNDFADLVALHVMSHERRADKVRPSSACGIRAVAESTGLLELFASALDCRVLRNSLWPSRGIPQTKGKKDRCPSNCSFGRLPSPCKLILMHLHSSLSANCPACPAHFLMRQGTAQTGSANVWSTFILRHQIAKPVSERGVKRVRRHGCSQRSRPSRTKSSSFR